MNNQIEVLPASKSDDELRAGIANAIYGNSAFSRYANQVNPPIHIVVERGRVTLEGVVNNNVDRVLAYSIASMFPGVFGEERVADRRRSEEGTGEALSRRSFDELDFVDDGNAAKPTSPRSAAAPRIAPGMHAHQPVAPALVESTAPGCCRSKS